MREIKSKHLVALSVILLGLNLLLLSDSKIEWGSVDFFSRHGIFFLVCISLFPRLTLFFSSVPFGGLLWWLGFFFYPRLLVATLATITYLKTNPLLVLIAWFVAISGELFEKVAIRRRSGFHFRAFEQKSVPTKSQGDVFEAEYKNVDN